MLVAKLSHPQSVLIGTTPTQTTTQLNCNITQTKRVQFLSPKKKVIFGPVFWVIFGVPLIKNPNFCSFLSPKEWQLRMMLTPGQNAP